MLLWIAMAVLAAAACVPLLVALGRANPVASTASGQAMAIYRDQLDEVGRDVARGVIADGDAEAARTEIARRLIREGETPVAASASTAQWRTIAAVVVFAMPVAALAFYLYLGSPLSPDQPLSSRPDALAQQEVVRLVAQVEAHLAKDPNDGKGWEVVAPVYARLGRSADAAHAWERALALLGSTADREMHYGAALVQVNGGTVTSDAAAAFRRATALAPNDLVSRYYLALALDQAGKEEEAAAAWNELLKDAPEVDRPAAMIRTDRLAPAFGVYRGGIIANLSPEQRQKMIGGMVSSLAERLKTEPGDADGWARLIRSYIVLQQLDDAQTALATARSALASDAAKLAIVEAAAKGLAEAPQ